MANPKKDKKQAAVEEPDPNNVEDIVQGVVAAAAAETTDEATLQKKRRMCRFPGCTKVIKSQGHCQRHGARAKRCKVEGCEKQAQGTHDGMCKRHWKAVHFPHQAAAAHASKDSAAAAAAAPQPEGDSVYDSILPASISFRPPNKKVDVVMEEEVFADGKIDPLDPPSAPEGAPVMPLVAFLQEGRDKEAGWHRTAERRARGMFRTQSLTSQLEPWERQLVSCSYCNNVVLLCRRHSPCLFSLVMLD